MKVIKKIIKKIITILKNSKVKRIVKYISKHIDDINEYVDMLIKKEGEDNGNKT